MRTRVPRVAVRVNRLLVQSHSEFGYYRHDRSDHNAAHDAAVKPKYREQHDVMSQRTGTGKLLFRSHVALITFTYVSVQRGETTCARIHASWAYPETICKRRSILRRHRAFKKGGKLFRCNWFFGFVLFFCMLMIPWVWTDCLFCSFQICSLYVLLVFKRSALMLTNCIHRYVLFIARLKGIYTYYEEEKKKVYKYHTLWTWKSTACVCYEQTLDIVVWLCILIWRGWKRIIRIRDSLICLAPYHPLLIYLIYL